MAPLESKDKHGLRGKGGTNEEEITPSVVSIERTPIILQSDEDPIQSPGTASRDSWGPESASETISLQGVEDCMLPGMTNDSASASNGTRVSESGISQVVDDCPLSGMDNGSVSANNDVETGATPAVTFPPPASWLNSSNAEELDDARVGAFSYRPGDVHRRRNNLPLFANKGRRRGGISSRSPSPSRTEAGVDEGSQNELGRDVRHDELDEDLNVPSTAYCVETGEHVEVTQVPAATAYAVEEDAIEDIHESEGDTLTSPNEAIPSLPEFAIPREIPRRKVIESLVDVSCGDESTDSNNGTSRAHATVVTGMGGIGKSAIAAAAVMDPEISSYFSDGICWLSLGPSKLSPVSFRNTLLALCSQISWDSELAMSQLGGFPFNVKETNESRTDDFKNLKAIVEPLFGERKILIVLDNAWHRDDLDHFAFGPQVRLLVTTRKQNISAEGSRALNACSLIFDEIQLSLPSEAESLQLLENVTGLSLSDNSELCSLSDAKDILWRCHFLPLAIVTIGLLLKGCESFSPLPASKILKSLESSGGGDIDQVNVHSSCYFIFDQSFGALGNGSDELTAVLRSCFAAFCACFTDSQGSRTSVPRVVVERFFEELLSGQGGYVSEVQRSSIKEHGISALNIVEMLRSVGFLDQHQGRDINDGSHFLIVHHDLQKEYGLKSAGIFEVSQRSFVPIGLLSFNKEEISSLDLARARANAIVVEMYEKITMQNRGWMPWKQHDWSSVNGTDRHYVMEFIITHMIRALQFNKAMQTMKDLSFVVLRLECFGVAKCRMWMLEEMKLAVQVSNEKEIGSKHWMKFQSVFDEAVVRAFIACKSKEEREKIWIENTESRMKWFLNGHWVMQTNIVTNFSLKYFLIRKIRVNHVKRVSMLLVDAGLGDHPFALGWHAMILLWSGNVSGAFEVRERLMKMLKDLFPDNHILVMFETTAMMYANIARGNYKEAIFHSKEFFRAVKSKYGEVDSMELASATAIIGDCYRYNDQTAESLEYFQEALQMYERLNYQGEVIPYVVSRIKEGETVLNSDPVA